MFLEFLSENLYFKFLEKLKQKFVYGEIPYRPNEIMTININNKPLIDLGWSPKINLQQGLRKF